MSKFLYIVGITASVLSATTIALANESYDPWHGAERESRFDYERQSEPLKEKRPQDISSGRVHLHDPEPHTFGTAPVVIEPLQTCFQNHTQGYHSSTEDCMP